MKLTLFSLGVLVAILAGLAHPQPRPVLHHDCTQPLAEMPIIHLHWIDDGTISGYCVDPQQHQDQEFRIRVLCGNPAIGQRDPLPDIAYRCDPDGRKK